MTTEPKHKFKIEQLALAPNPDMMETALAFMRDIGIDRWVEDHVQATGRVKGVSDRTNEADLRFNYDMFSGNELELLHYTTGENWIEGITPTVSHIGMHCEEEDLMFWRDLLWGKWRCPVIQEVWTDSHTNEYLQNNGRKYHYVIFSTRHFIGTDMKFIVRREP